MWKYLTLILSLAACSPSPPTTNQVTPVSNGQTTSTETSDTDVSPIPGTDFKVASFLTLPAIGTEPGMSHKDSRTAKMTAAKEVNDELKSHLVDASRDMIAHVQYQRARIFLAVACQLVNAPAPPGSSEPQKTAHRAKMIEAAHLFFPGVEISLNASVDADGKKSPEAAQILLIMAFSFNPDQTCSRTENIWKPGS